MYIEIESPKRKVHITSVEINQLQISFFRENFIYLVFETIKEKEDFLESFLNYSDTVFKEGESYIELNSQFISREEVLYSNFNFIETKKFEVETYKLSNSKGFLEISFFNRDKNIKFFFFQHLIKLIKENLKNDPHWRN